MDAWGDTWLAGAWLPGSWGGDSVAPSPAPATGGAGYWPARRRRRDDEEQREEQPVDALAEIEAAQEQRKAAVEEFGRLAANALRSIGSADDLALQWRLEALQRQLVAMQAQQQAAFLAAARAAQDQRQRALTDDELALILLLAC